MPVSEIPALTTKKRRVLAQRSRAHDRRRCEPLGRSGGMLPREKNQDIYLHFLHFEITVNGVFFLDFLRSTKKSSATACNNECKPCTKSRQSILFPHPKLPQSYARIPKWKNGWKKQENTGEKQLKTARNHAKKTG